MLTADEQLFDAVAGFLASGLIEAQPAMVIATPDHREGISRKLVDRFVDVRRASRAGDLVFLDVDEMLSLIMPGGALDEPAFDRHLSAIIDLTLRGRSRTTLRRYGEIVDVLAMRGQTREAMRVETLWRTLTARYGVMSFDRGWALAG